MIPKHSMDADVSYSAYPYTLGSVGGAIYKVTFLSLNRRFEALRKSPDIKMSETARTGLSHGRMEKCLRAFKACYPNPLTPYSQVASLRSCCGPLSINFIATLGSFLP